jgi:class 3 adenylate cyclase
VSTLTAYVFPRVLLDGTPWKSIWEEREHRVTRWGLRLGLSAGVPIYLIHHWFIDTPLGLQPAAWWQAYRFGCAGLCAFALALSFTPVGKGQGIRLLGMVVGSTLSYFQARSMVMSDTVPYLYSVLLPVLATLVMQVSPLASTAYLACLFGVTLPSFAEAGVHPSHLLSAVALGFASVNLFRSRMVVDVAAFVASQGKLQTEKRLIESELELSQEIRAFLPREIYERIATMLRGRGMSVGEAVEDALRPRQKVVACVFSDIRGFTERSKDLTGYLTESALPNIRSCTELVEAHRGIPRLVGDLVFGYFDARPAEENVDDALRCAAALVLKNEALNRRGDVPPVQRYVLLSFGQAVVGNIGGRDSSREITALGAPVNILSRMDLLSKDPKIIPHLSANNVLVTSSAAQVIQSRMPNIVIRPLALGPLGVSLRDFAEEDAIWLVPVGSENPSLAVEPIAARS